jgi:1-acyl-sn-glycerol-3-phosphate acyltransferase
MIYRLTWLGLRAFFRLLLRWRITGAENVPRVGPVILASNHVSYLDPPVVGVGIWRPCAYLAKEELFHHRLFGWYLRKLNAFPVQRGAADRAALKRALEVLEQGMPLVLFPEGTRSEDGELQEPQMGVGMIAYRSGAPVVPAYVEGTGRVLGRSGGFHPHPIAVTYGTPLHFQAAEGEKPGRAEYEAAARQVMAAIAGLRDRDASGSGGKET